MLIFFIVTSDILPLKSLNIENPHPGSELSTSYDPTASRYGCSKCHLCRLKKTIVDLASLKDTVLDEITQLKKQHPNIEPTVVVSVDRRVEYGSFPPPLFHYPRMWSSHTACLQTGRR